MLKAPPTMKSFYKIATHNKFLITKFDIFASFSEIALIFFR